MATAYVGTVGAVTDGTDDVVQLVTRFSFDWDREFFNTTSFGTTDWQTTTVGLHKLVGTAEGFSDDGAGTLVNVTNLIADSATFVLTIGTGRTYSFSGVWTSFSPESEVGQPTRWSGTFESTGVVTLA